MEKERKKNEFMKVEYSSQREKILELENEIKNCRLNEKASQVLFGKGWTCEPCIGL